jgi:hypothetical protein
MDNVHEVCHLNKPSSQTFRIEEMKLFSVDTHNRWIQVGVSLDDVAELLRTCIQRLSPGVDIAL